MPRLLPWASARPSFTVRDSDAAAAALGEREAIIYRPRMIFVEDGICFLYEGDAGYEAEDQEVPGPRHRTYMINDKLEYIRET